MGGIDVIRGIGFQQAVAVQSCLDVLTSSSCSAVVVEGTAEVVDIEVLGLDGQPTLHQQVKTRKEPDTWAVGESLGVVNDWFEQGGKAERFEFITDGSLGPSAVKLVTALRTGQFPPDIADKVTAHNAIDMARMGAVLVTSRASRTDQQLATASHRLCQLQPGTPAAQAIVLADSAIDRLFKELFLRGGQEDISARTLTRDDLASILAVDLRVIDSPTWAEGVRDAWLSHAASTELTALSPLLGTAEVWSPALTRGLEEGGRDAAIHEVTEMPLALVVGGSGTGKSMFCQAMKRDAAPSGVAVVVIEALDIVVGRLPSSLSQALSASLGRFVNPDAGAEVLADDRCIVAIDGLTEAGEAATAIAEDLARATTSPDVRCHFVLTGRDGPALRSLCGRMGQVVGYRMKPWGWQERDRYLQPLVVESDRFHARGTLEDHLGAGADNPLLFSMAANLMLSGRAPDLPAHIYRDCIEALCDRNHVDPSSVGVVLGLAFGHLIEDGVRTASRFEWDVALGRAIEDLGAATGVNLDPVQVGADAWKSGLITTVGFTNRVSALHDSIADFLAGAATAKGLRALWAPDARGSHDSLRFTVQMVDPVDAEWSRLLASDAPFEVAALSSIPEPELTPDAPEAVTDLLSRLAGPLLPEGSCVVMGRRSETVFARIDPDGVPRWTEESLLDSARKGETRDVRNGELAAAVDLWSRLVRRALQHPGSLGPSQQSWRDDPA